MDRCTGSHDKTDMLKTALRDTISQHFRDKMSWLQSIGGGGGGGGGGGILFSKG